MVAGCLQKVTVVPVHQDRQEHLLKEMPSALGLRPKNYGAISETPADARGTTATYA
jgi:hypothetical protein